MCLSTVLTPRSERAFAGGGPERGEGAWGSSRAQKGARGIRAIPIPIPIRGCARAEQRLGRTGICGTAGAWGAG